MVGFNYQMEYPIEKQQLAPSQHRFHNIEVLLLIKIS